MLNILCWLREFSSIAAVCVLLQSKHDRFKCSVHTVVCKEGRSHVLFTLFCVWLHIKMCTTYCVVFLFCFSSCCVPYFVGFSELSIFDCPFGIL